MDSKVQRFTDVAEDKPKKRKMPPNAGKGRKAGVPNKVTGDVKAMILGALEQAGGQAYLAEQAEQNPGAFLSLIGKVIPKEVSAEVRGVIEHVLADRLKEARERTKSAG
jgi:hypothetical protein